MKLRRWSFKENKYKSFNIPDNYKVGICEEMDTIVNCPHCGKELAFGDTYTSVEIHDNMGFGYGVCEECYNEELERRKMYEC